MKQSPTTILANGNCQSSDGFAMQGKHNFAVETTGPAQRDARINLIGSSNMACPILF